MAKSKSQAPTLYGPDGRPVRRRELPRERAAPSRYSLRQPFSDRRVAPWLNPSKLMRVLADAAMGETEEFLTLAEEVEERDLHYASVLGTRKRAAALIKPAFEPASPSKRDRDIAADARALAARPGWHRMCHCLLDALGKGYAACEIAWETSGRLWRPRKVEWRDPRWFRLDRDDGRALRLVTEADSAEGEPLEPFQWIVHQPELKSGLPVRGGLARLAAVAIMCKSFALTDWMRFGELLGIPFRLGKYGPGASEEDIGTLLSALASLQSDGAGAVPDSMSLELVTAPSGQGAAEFHRTLADWIDRQVSKGVLGQTMTSDDGSSRSQAEVHDRVRQDIREDDAIQLAETLQRDLVDPWTALNFGAEAEPPRLSLPAPDPDRRKAVLEALEALVPLGARVDESWARAQFGIPDPEEGAALLEPDPGFDDAAARGSGSGPRADPGPGQDLLAELEGRALGGGGWRRAMDPMLAPVIELLERSETLEQFEAGMADALGEMDDSELRRALAAATFAARGLGDARDEP